MRVFQDDGGRGVDALSGHARGDLHPSEDVGGTRPQTFQGER